MRKKYHFIIEYTENENFKNVIKSFGIELPMAKITLAFSDSMKNASMMHYDYIIELTKYELLYLRLACKSGEFIEILNEIEREIA